MVTRPKPPSGLSLNLLDQLTFYGCYHTKGWNQAIHFVFVPAIMWTVGIWLAYLPPVSDFDLPARLGFLPAWAASAALPNWAMVMMAAYTVYYMLLEPFAGGSWGLLLGAPMWVTATAVRQALPHAWAWALGLHILSWFLQVEVGHILIEHRRPALLDSFFQSLVLAGLFAWMEGLFVLGYRPALQAELAERIARYTAAAAADKAPTEALLTCEGGAAK